MQASLLIEDWYQSFQTDKVKQESEINHDLIGGECKPREKIEIQMESMYNSRMRQYEDQRITLLVKMISNSGIIQAGSISFSPFGKEAFEKSESSAPLEKCPDKLASIVFSHCYQISKFQENPSFILIRDSSSLKKNAFQHSKSGINLYNTNEKRTRIERVQSTYMINTPEKKAQNKQEIFDTFQKSQVQEKITREDFNKSRVLYTVNFEEQNPLEYFERAALHKQIAKLRAEVKLFKGEQFNQKQRKLKEENNAIMSELDRANDRIKSFQRQQRSTVLVQKENKDEIDRLKSKISSLEILKTEMQTLMISKQKKYKQLQNQYKRLQISYQEVQAELVSTLKRIEIKENNSQQEFKKLTQKLEVTENQRKKIINDQNQMLLKFEQTEKKNQICLKDKEILFFQQKNRILKINQLLSNQLQQLKMQYAQKQVNIKQLLEKVQSTKESETCCKERIKNLSLEVEKIQLSLNTSQNQNQEFLTQMELFKNIQLEKTSFKKKNQQILAELSKVEQKSNRNDLEIRNLNEKLISLEKKLNDRTRERDALNIKNSSLQNIIDSLEKDLSNLQKKVEDLEASNFAFNQKYNNIQNNFQKDKMQWKSLQIRYQDELLDFTRKGEILRQQLEDQKNIIQKQKEEIFELNKQLRVLNDKKLELNSTLMSFRQQLKNSHQKIVEKESSLNMLQSQLSDFQKREKNQSTQLKLQTQELFGVKKSLKSLETQIFLAKERYTQVETKVEQQREWYEEKVKQLEKIISKQYQELVQSNISQTTLSEQLRTCKINLQSKINENYELKDSNQKLIQQITQKDIKLKQKGFQVKNLQEKNQSILQLHQFQKKKANSFQKILINTREEWKQYKISTINAFINFMNQIFKENLSIRPLLVPFPDEILSEMQIDAFKKIFSLQTKLNTQILQISSEKTLLQEQVRQLKQNLLALEKENNNKLEKLKNFYFDSQQKNKLKIDEAQFLINTLEEQKIFNLHQIQKLNNELLKKDDLIDELKNVINNTLEQVQDKTKKIRDAEQLVINLKTSEIKLQATIEGQNFHLSQEKDAVIDYLKIKNSESEKKIEIIEKTILQKEDVIKLYQKKLIDSEYQREKNQDSTQEFQDKVESLKKENEQLNKKMIILQNDIKKLKTNTVQSKITQDNQNIQISQLQNQLTLRYEQLSSAEVNIEKLKDQICILKDLNEQLKKKIFEKEVKEKIAQQRQVRESFKLKQQIIQLSSLIELNEFQLSQQEAEISQLTSQKNTLNQDLIKRKYQFSKLQDKLSTLQTQIYSVKQQKQIIKNEKSELLAQNKKLKQIKDVLENELSLLQNQIEGFQQKQKEAENQKRKFEAMEYEMLKNKRLQGVQSASQINRYTRTNRDEKRKIRELQKHVDIYNKKIRNHYDYYYSTTQV